LKEVNIIMSSIPRKLLVEAPVRGIANAIAQSFKDSLYRGRGGYRRQELEAPDLLGGFVEGIERAAPSIFSLAFKVAAFYFGVKLLNRLLDGTPQGGGVAGVPVGCRCVKWECY